VPLLPVAAALVTGVVQQITVGPPEGGQMWAGFLLVSAVVVRQLLAVRDATQLAERVHAQAWQDPLTGLANRAQLGQRLRRAVERAPAEGGQVGVLLLDLDGFKAVNDGQGHQVGDELLRVVADRLRACLRPQDVAARLGGDEFVVLVEDLPAPAVEALAVRLLAALRAPVALGATTVRVAGSLGIVVGDGRSSADELLADADLAMYAAKRAGRGRYSWYAPGQRAELEARVRLEDDLKQAVDAGEFVAHFQPLVDLGRGRVTGAEALVRWAHPSRGLLAPGAFLPAAEELGLMPEIGRRVLAQALHAAAGWPHAAGEPMTISVNLSASQLADPALRAFLVETLAASGCPPEAVLLELTETLVLDDLDGAAASMAALKELGVRIALDDFGTGYSALSALRALPVDVLKIDKAFIDELGTGADSGLSAAMIGLAASLALTPIAEGIESAAQVSALTELACPLGQGFFYARALPDDEFRALLDAPLAPAGRPAPVARAA
jgi:diguanylate cyclase (GGDEF)-like protein